jgi:adenylosuccinate synthase
MHREFPRQHRVLYESSPAYETFEGWGEDISSIRRLSDLPPQARNYLDFVAAQTRVPIGWVSVGPERRQLISL